MRISRTFGSLHASSACEKHRPALDFKGFIGSVSYVRKFLAKRPLGSTDSGVDARGQLLHVAGVINRNDVS
jgi:hypothetical protein